MNPCTNRYARRTSSLSDQTPPSGFARGHLIFDEMHNRCAILAPDGTYQQSDPLGSSVSIVDRPTIAAGFNRQTVSDRQVWVEHTIVDGQPDIVRELLSDVVEGLRAGTASKQALRLLGLRETWDHLEKHGFVEARSFVEQCNEQCNSNKLLPHLGSRGGLSEDGVLEPCFSCFVSSPID